MAATVVVAEREEKAAVTQEEVEAKVDVDEPGSGKSRGSYGKSGAKSVNLTNKPAGEEEGLDTCYERNLTAANLIARLRLKLQSLSLVRHL